MKLKPKSIGVIGGMGALASADFGLRVMKASAARGAKSDAEFPRYILDSIPFASSTELGCGELDELTETVRGAVDRMNEAGIELLVAVCNTIHLHIQHILEPGDPHFINIVDSTIQRLDRRNVQRVLVLSSEESSDAGLYSNRLDRDHFDFWEVNREIYPQHQDRVNQAIAAVIRADFDRARRLTESVIRPFANKVDSVILGCTELPLARPIVPGVQIIDPNQILAETLVEVAYSGAPPIGVPPGDSIANDIGPAIKKRGLVA